MGGPELVVLGAGSILPRAGYGCAGYALLHDGADAGEVTLLDCGPGSTRALGAAGIELARVRRVVLSHFHTDHCLDLFALFFARRSPFYPPGFPPLEVVGPPGTRSLVEDGVRALKGHPRAVDTTVVEVPVGADGPGRHDADAVALECAPTFHTDTAVAWRATLPGGESLTFSGDTGEQETVSALASGCDLFVAECSFPDDEAQSNHLTPRGAGRLAAAAGCGALLLSHFYPPMDPERARAGAAEVFSGPVEVARDGSRHALRSA